MALRCSMRPLGQPGLLRWLWVQGWRHRAVAGVRIEAGAPQVCYGPVEGCVDEPGPETRGVHQGQWVGIGGHGLTEPEPKPKVWWSGGGSDVLSDELEQVHMHTRSAMDQVRGVRTSQDQRTEEHTNASESAMAVMNWLSQNRNLKVWRSGVSSGHVQVCIGGCGHAVGGRCRIMGWCGHAVGGRGCDMGGQNRDVGGWGRDMGSQNWDVGGRGCTVGMECNMGGRGLCVSMGGWDHNVDGGWDGRDCCRGDWDSC